jgi:hypothetical protein
MLDGWKLLGPAPPEPPEQPKELVEKFAEGTKLRFAMGTKLMEEPPIPPEQPKEEIVEGVKLSVDGWTKDGLNVEIVETLVVGKYETPGATTVPR